MKNHEGLGLFIFTLFCFIVFVIFPIFFYFNTEKYESKKQCPQKEQQPSRKQRQKGTKTPQNTLAPSFCSLFHNTQAKTLKQQQKSILGRVFKGSKFSS